MMNKHTQLQQRIGDSVELCSQIEERLDIEEIKQTYNKRSCQRLETDLQVLKAHGRKSVFELMLCSSHRAFMKFLREHGE